MSRPIILIQSDKFYIVDTKRLNRKGRPKMLKKRFDNVKQVKMCLDKYLDSDIRFDYLKGKEAIDLGLEIMRYAPQLNVYLRKYCYENYMVTDQDKKSYRTKFRRHNRNKRGEYYKRFG